LLFHVLLHFGECGGQNKNTKISVSLYTLIGPLRPGIALLAMNASELSDELIGLIASGDRAAAILVCYRTNGGDLENAWENVRRLSIELGESSAAFLKSAAVDQNVKDLRAYLAQNFWERRKDQIQAGTLQ